MKPIRTIWMAGAVGILVMVATSACAASNTAVYSNNDGAAVRLVQADPWEQQRKDKQQMQRLWQRQSDVSQHLWNLQQQQIQQMQHRQRPPAVIPPNPPGPNHHHHHGYLYYYVPIQWAWTPWGWQPTAWAGPIPLE